MNIPHIHLMLNHLPVIGVIFCGALLAVAIILKNVQFQRVAFLFLFIVALSAIPVYLTGEPAEEIIEDIPGVSETFIEEHEQVALIALVAMEIVGGLSLLGLILYRKTSGPPGHLTSGILVLTIVVMALMAWTAYLGGHIRHSEIRPDFKITTPADSGKETSQGGK